MSTFSLLWANLFRKRTRTFLTLFSVAIAFLLFMLLRAVAGAFDGGINLAGVDRLIVSPKFSVIDSLPVSQKQQLLAIEGVEQVASANWFGGKYQEPRNFFPKYPVEPEDYFGVYSELEISPEHLQAFVQTRVGAVASRSLAEQYNWSIGDIIPIEADIWPKADDTRLWEFELVGTFTTNDGSSEPPLFLFNYDYFSEAVAFFGKDQVGWWNLKLSEPDRAEAIASEIDGLFENSQDPTRSATEDEFNRQFASQLGDMGFITTMIMGAVFFTIVLLTANTMTQALRERIPELAVLKTLGFSDTSVSLLVLTEAILLCLVGGAIGIGIALLMEPGLRDGLESVLGTFRMTGEDAGLGLLLALVIGLLIGSVPAITAKRLTITDALRER